MAKQIQRPFPRVSLEEALKVPRALKEHNGGNPWAAGEVAEALGLGKKSSNFYYYTAASRDFGFTEGTRDTPRIELRDLGRQAVYPRTDAEASEALMEAFMGIDIFRQVVQHYNGNNLPDEPFLGNTLEQEFGLHRDVHDEFVQLFQENCRFLGIGHTLGAGAGVTGSNGGVASGSSDAVTVAEPEGGDDAPVCFVIMPFTERDDRHATGFFQEVLTNVFTPAAAAAGFRVKTAQRRGSDVIQATIVNELLKADLVLADLTEHNPNVLFELGMRMLQDKPVALVRAKGTSPIFDVDNMLRLVEYDPNLWKSTVERDIPKIQEHIDATWENRDSEETFMKILKRREPPATPASS